MPARWRTALLLSLGTACGGDSSNGSTPPPPAAARPEARFGHVMAFHAASGKVILFGGERSVSARARLGDTWEWDGATWRRLDVTGPSPRMDAVMTYDSGRG